MDGVERSRNGRTRSALTSANGEPRQGRARQRAYMIAALPDGDEQELAELRELLRTAGVAAVGEMVQKT